MTIEGWFVAEEEVEEGFGGGVGGAAEEAD